MCVRHILVSVRCSLFDQHVSRRLPEHLPSVLHGIGSGHEQARETSGQPPSQARQHPRALARCDASSTRLKLRKNQTTTHETRPCTRRITLRLIDSLYARAPTASLRLIDLAYARAHWSKLFLNLQQKLSELRHQGTRFQLHNSSAGQARICPSNSTSAGQARISPSSTQEG